jgi:hypothetical protein
MCVTDLDPDLDITENEQVPGVAWGQAGQPGKYAGVAWGQLGRQDDYARDAAAGEAQDTEEAAASR